MDGLNVFSWIAIICAILIIGVTLILRYIRRNDDYWTKRGVPNVPRENMFTVLKIISEKNLAQLQLERSLKQAKVCGYLELSKPGLMIRDPELLKDILVKDFHVFHFRREFKTVDTMLNSMVSNLEGEDWKRVRTIITPVFTTKRLKMMTNIMNECAETVMGVFEKELENGGIVDVKRIFGSFTLDVIARAAFATKIDSINDPENIFIEYSKQLLPSFPYKYLLLLLFMPNWLIFKLRLGPLKANDFFKDVICKVIEERNQKGQRFNDLLQLLTDATDEHLMNNSGKSPDRESVEEETDQYGSIIHKETNDNRKYKHLSREELIAQCVLFFTVGYETTASTIAFLAYALATNPECQEKLLKEVDAAFENYNEMNYDVIRSMKYLDATVSETLRMYTPAIITQRTACEDYKLGNTGITIEKGVIISVPIYAMHFDPDLFHEPEKFKPERFLEPSHHPYAYLPFGAGPRNCLGMRFALMNIKICMSNILRQYRFRLAENTKVPLEFKKGVLFLSVMELPLKIEKRMDAKI